jgi:hypothetical protein
MDELEDFLQTFGNTCSGRGKLTGQRQLACFYTVLLLSVVKSLVIDACSLRSRYGTTSSWNDADAVRVNSSYKALVSVFFWASKTDLMTESMFVDLNLSFQKDVEDTRNMTRTSEWTT